MRNFAAFEIIETLKKKGYTVFQNGKPLNLNIVGIRADNAVPGKFDDMLYCFYLVDKQWVKMCWSITTDPGKFYLQNPLNVEGTAILCEGQYRSAFKLGLHHGKYKALVQAKPVKVTRDFNQDSKLDFHSYKTEVGMFGINIHRASASHTSTIVGKWSAGCQVFQNPENFKTFIALCERSAELYGNSFTYTLLNERDLK